MEETVAKSEGRALLCARVSEAIRELGRMRTPERIRGDVIPEGRADVIVQGAIVVLAVLEHYGLESMIVSSRGVRYGLLAELAAEAT
jgi:exopolyphosphatase/pppGpp-phosphohydrolase